MKLKISQLAIFWLIVTIARAQPDADFSAGPVTGCAPLLVNFTDLSSGTPTQWRWDLGNGTVSFLKNPSVTYLNPGTYHVKLKVTGATGTDSVIKNNFITVYAFPTVNFSASSRTGCFPQQIQFTDSSTCAGGTIASWLWDFGDGTLSTQQHPAHTYTSAGSFNVSLRVTTSNGCSKILTRNFYISMYDGVDASFSINRSNSCTLPVSVSFTNQTTGPGSIRYLWNFGNGGTSTDANPTYTYTQSGNYSVRLIATNSNGCKDTFVITNGIRLGTVTPDFSSNSVACQHSATSFRNISSPTPVSSIWYFGDNTAAYSLHADHIYRNPGTYNVKLVSDFGACRDSIIKQITVQPAPAAQFAGTDTVSCKFPYSAAFTNQSLRSVTYSWNFGDGSTSSQANPTHTYNTEGSYSVSLVATDAIGCTDTFTRRNFVKIRLPVVSIDSLPREGCAPFTCSFNTRLISSEPAVSYLWDFGDGTTSAQANPTHTFDSGLFQIRLIISTAGGCTDTLVVPGAIKVGKKPIADFYGNPLNVCANTPVSFYDLTRDTATRWLWDFGDGGTGTTQNPSHLYSDTGLFTVRLIAYNNGCSDTMIKENYVHIDPPIAKILSDFSCEDKFRRNFTGDRSIGADTYLWDFGDGSTSAQANPSHVYGSVGAYMVVLKVYNVRTGCESVREKRIIIADEHADFRVSDSVLCKYAPFHFTALNNGYVSQYQWDFGDGVAGTGSSVTHAYTLSGNYSVSLIITDSVGCLDTMIRNQILRVNGPTAVFSTNITGTCILTGVNFSDSSYSDGINPIVTRSWNFGDGSTSTTTVAGATHAYAGPGYYTVSLTVTDSLGCSDRKTIPNIVQITRPTARFSSPDTVTCPGRTVRFNNTSAGNGLRYLWNFGDNGTDTNANPSHVYAADGYYTVRLTVRDRYGCLDSAVKMNYIRVVTGRAGFTASDTFSSCPPLLVNFTNASRDAVSYSWNFGDGTSSLLASPSHFYTEAGIYTVTLTAKGRGGCYTQFSKSIEIRGPSGRFSYAPLEGCQPLAVRFSAQTKNRDRIIWDFSDGVTVTTTDSVITHVYTLPGLYVPRMILENNSGCRVPVQGTDTIHVHGVTAGMSFSPDVICGSGPVRFSNTTLSADSILSYQWYFGDRTTSNEKAPEHTYTAAGTYYPMLMVQTTAGCRDTMISTVPVKIAQSPVAVIHQGANACAPASISLTASISNPDTCSLRWSWNFGNGQTSAQEDPGTVVFVNAGDFNIKLILTNSLGCADTANTLVTAYENPRVSAGNDTFRCYGNSVMLTAGGAEDYSWSPSRGLSCTQCRQPVASPDSTITYSVTGTSVHGCTGSDQVTVQVVYPFSINVSPPDTVCTGESLLMYAGGADSFYWTPAVNRMSPNFSLVNAQPSTTTTYRVTGRDRFHCFSETKDIPVKVYPIPAVDAGNDISIPSGGTADLMPTVSSDVTEVTWSPTGSIYRSTYPGISVKPRETTEYLVEVSNEGGCRARDQITVFVTCDGANVFIPNTFSPNHDGMNDVFYVRGKGLFKIRSVRIFNRWGEMIFDRSEVTPNNMNEGWDGTYKGRPLTPDVYVYAIELTCENNGSMLLKGNVALMR